MFMSNLLADMCVPCVLAVLAETRRGQLEPLKMEFQLVVIHLVVQGRKACALQEQQ